MIIYNIDWLNNNNIRKQAEDAYQLGIINKDEKDCIVDNYPVGFYSSNFFTRIGLGILTFIIVLFILGFFALLVTSISENISVLMLLTGTLCYFGLEFMVRQNSHFQSGVDDILLYMATIFIVSGLCYNASFNWRFSESIVAFLCFIVTLLASLRFIDRLTTTAAYVAFFAFVFYSYLLLGTIAKATMPFVAIALSATIYYVAVTIEKNEKWIHYRGCLLVVKILSLITFYGGGNYFVIRELSNSMFQLNLKPTDSITLGWFFWLWTFAIPVLYLLKGIAKKERDFIHVSIVLFVASIATFRYYHQVLPTEVAFLIAGSFLIAISYGLIKYLTTPKNNFTASLINDTKNFGNIEALIAVSIAPTAPKIPAQGLTEFGGGNSGGAGATGSY